MGWQATSLTGQNWQRQSLLQQPNTCSTHFRFFWLRSNPGSSFSCGWCPNFINHKGHEVTRRGGSVKACFSQPKLLFGPLPVLLALLESWIFLLLWMRPNFINHKGHEVTRRGGSVKALLQPTK